MERWLALHITLPLQRFLSAQACCVRQTRKIIGFAHCDVRNHMSHDAMDDGFFPPVSQKA